jgi:hypothetical protein
MAEARHFRDFAGADARPLLAVALPAAGAPQRLAIAAVGPGREFFGAIVTCGRTSAARVLRWRAASSALVCEEVRDEWNFSVRSSLQNCKWRRIGIYGIVAMGVSGTRKLLKCSNTKMNIVG